MADELPPRDPKITTGERRAIVEEVRREIERTPAMGTPGPSDSSEAMQALHFQRCWDRGPACHLDKRMEAIEKEIESMRLEKAEEKGAAREMAREAGKAAALRAAVFAGVFSLLAAIGGMVAQRLWPPSAHAQPTQIQK